MSSARPNWVFHSTSFRLSAAYAVLLVVAFLVTAMVAWLATKSAAEREVRERITNEMAALQSEIRIEGMTAAILDIQSHIERPGSLEYRLVDPTGKLIVGNLDIGPATPGWSAADITDKREEENEEEDFLVLTERTPDGSLLSIGDDLDKAEGIRAVVLNSLLWVATPTLILVIGIGVFLAYGAAKRMRALSSAMAEVGRGNLTTRAPERGSDEIARISAGVNEMVERIDTLIVNIRRVSTDIAHDLRTPLAHVRQDLETAAASADPQTREAIRAAQGRLDDMLRIFQAILRLAEIDADAGGARARFVEVDLIGVIERVADAYRPDIEASGHALAVDVPATAVNVTGDRDLLTLSLANLIENAMRHTPSGTTIRVGVTAGPGPIALFVEDRGQGIPASEHQRVLEPFVRLDASRTTPGAGLGLSIVNAIARLHGASLLLGDAGPGLRVTMRWPS